jgi:GNAT superfamily N-acetyltransferase
VSRRGIREQTSFEMRIETVVTELEMTERPALHVPVPSLRLGVMRAAPIPVHFYRYLYDTVGRTHHWVERKRWDDAKLAARINDAAVTVMVLYAGGVPAGFYELAADAPGTVRLALFGIVPDYRGRGLGRYFLAHAIREAWARTPERVRVETCTLDHVAALPLYQKMGFRPIGRRSRVVEALDETA